MSYRNTIKAHQFTYAQKSTLARCSCRHWFLSGASEGSAVQSHKYHIENLPEDRVSNPHPPKVWDQLPSSSVETIQTTFGELCPKARRSLAIARDILGDQTVRKLLPTIQFRVGSFTCVD